jgi:hypothetical protein
VKVNWGLAYRIEHKYQEIALEKERYGIKFDTEKAKEYEQFLEEELGRLYWDVEPFLSHYVEQPGKEVSRPFTKAGKISKQAEKWAEADKIVGPFTPVKFPKIELSQEEKLKQHLIKLGWEPTEYTPVTEKGGGGNPKLRPNKEPCPNLRLIEGFPGDSLADYYTLIHKYRQLKLFVRNVRPDGRITAQTNTCGTNTGREKHKVVANLPKPSRDENGLVYYPNNNPYFGTELRSLFTVEDGRVMVGCDAAGLEIRLAAHYAQDDELIESLTYGSKETADDPHTLVMKDAGLESRDWGKKGVYVGIYGARAEKFASEFGVSLERGAEIREAIQKRFPGVFELKPAVEKAAQRGYLIGLDGRKVWMRKDKQGKIQFWKAVNTLFQSAGGIVMKVAACYNDKWVKDKKLDSHLLLAYHDEYERDAIEDQGEEVGELMAESIRQAGRFFNLRCPLEGEYGVGKNWAEVH